MAKRKQPAALRKYWAAKRRGKKSRSSPRRTVKTMARRRRYYGRKRSAGRKKWSAFKMVKGIAYTGALIAPGYMFYSETKNPMQTIQRYAGIGIDGKFDTAHLVQMYLPVAALAVIDFATTKIPLQQKIARGVNNLLG